MINALVVAFEMMPVIITLNLAYLETRCIFILIGMKEDKNDTR